jgi:hypothetical protein
MYTYIMQQLEIKFHISKEEGYKQVNSTVV